MFILSNFLQAFAQLLYTILNIYLDRYYCSDSVLDSDYNL